MNRVMSDKITYIDNGEDATLDKVLALLTAIKASEDKASKPPQTIVKLKTYSGEEGHTRGRPGKVGGSIPRGGRAVGHTTAGLTEEQKAAKRQYQKDRWAIRKKADDAYLISLGMVDIGQRADLTKLIQKATGKKSVLPGEFIKSAYIMEDEETGLHTEINRIYLSLTKSHFKVFGYVRDKDGDIASAEIERTIREDGEVHHDYFKLYDVDQGQGFGTRYYQNSEKAYMKAGIKQVTLEANIDVGGYVWAKMGFDFVDSNHADRARAELADTAAGEILTRMSDDRSPADLRLTEWAKPIIGDAKSYHAQRSNLKVHIEHHLIPSSDAWDLATFDIPDLKYDMIIQSKPVFVNVGKAFMLGRSWNGIKSMDPTSAGWQVGAAYYKSKGSKKFIK